VQPGCDCPQTGGRSAAVMGKSAGILLDPGGKNYYIYLGNYRACTKTI